MEQSTLLEVRDLRVEYTSGQSVVHALNGVSFDLHRGETLGLVGETGAGKTTTALSILRLLPDRTGHIRSGEIVFDGIPLLGLNEHAMEAIRGARISMIFQDPMTALNPVIPVGKQIEEALFLHNTDGLPSSALGSRVDEILGMVGIAPERKKEYPHQFSGGMKQRVVIAMALACTPELLIADEPTTALDVTIQAQVLGMMAEFKQKLDMSMIMITHDLGIVAKTCDRVAVLYSGQIVETGTFEDFFVGQKHHPYTDGLFGSIPSLEGEETRLHPIEGELPDPTALPEGCAFHPRCPHCTERCRTAQPPEFKRGTHMVRCILFEKEEGYREQ
ncbi:MAG TPA: ABC transporter ATP-binding protein [Candidatus Ventrousia excrementavium]|uniref:ABC transporter ATP-binding protein n=1 Tax=Candidatus Ventrousia excrementavium TaxID=2840961 RepID=A0A9D1S2K9_9CLOT|nr:ABC transporter ATP-binding protein [Candidatus Ventrousia excrementavium]